MTTKQAEMSGSTTGAPEIRPVRRVITGEDAQGQSMIVYDGPALNVVTAPAIAQVIWATGDGAAPGDEPAPANHKFGFHSENGSILRIADFPPDTSYNKEEMGRFLDDYGVRDHNNPRHFWFHKTQSLDYAIVLEGEIYAMMDKGETLLRQGDVLVQRATNHSWSNRSGRNCRMAFILLALPDGATP